VSSGNNVDVSDHTGVSNNLLFSQCTVILNGTTITQSSEHYNYRSYVEILLTYGTDAAATHLTNAYWYCDTGDMKPCDPTTATITAVTNRGFVTRWDKLNASKELQLFGRLHSDVFNVPLVLLPGVSLQIRLTKASPPLVLHDEHASRFKDQFQIFGRPIIGETRETRPRHTVSSYCYTDYGSSRTL